MSNPNKVVETTYCAKHNIPSFHKADGTVQHTCGECHPEVLPEKVHKCRITNWGAHAAAAGGFCDDETLEWLKMCATITLQCPPKAENALYDDILDLTGEDFNGNYQKANNHNKFWYSCWVEFDWDDSLKINPAFSVKQKGNRKVVYSNDFVGFLLANGLKVGRNS